MYINVLITEDKHSEGGEGDSSLLISLYFFAFLKILLGYVNHHALHH